MDPEMPDASPDRSSAAAAAAAAAAAPAARDNHDEGQEQVDIVIIGGGIIGCTTAYYLTRHPAYSPTKHRITLLEATRVAGGASGKAGGLLAQWAYPASLVRLSFDLHAELAAEHNGAVAWGYRTIRCGKLTARHRHLAVEDAIDSDNAAAAPSSGVGGSLAWAAQQIFSWMPLGKRREVEKDPGNLVPPVETPEDLDWFRQECMRKYEDIAPERETAQLQPYQFTTAMASLAEEKGVKMVIGRAEEIEYEYTTPEEGSKNMPEAPPTKKVQAVRYVDKATAQSVRIPASVVVLAAGPWTQDLFPSAPMSALRAHSVTIKPTRPLSGYCLFTEISVPVTSPATSPSQSHGPEKGGLFPGAGKAPARVVGPEIYSRLHEVYVAGGGDTEVPLPPSTDEVEVDRAACQLIEDAVTSVSDELSGGIVTARRACYLPTVDLPSGNPLVGRTWIDGLLLATGHSCWGINNAPATGKLISEMLFDGETTSADISKLDPRKVL